MKVQFPWRRVILNKERPVREICRNPMEYDEARAELEGFMRNFNFARIVSAGAILLGAGVAAESWLKNDKLVESVETKVREIQPSRDEKRFDEIGWAPSILAAEALARKTKRPMFLFTYNGKIDTGRC